MRYETTTGLGYFEDEQGRVIDYYQLTPGEYEAGGPRSTAVDVKSRDGLPPVDPEYRPGAPEVASFEARVRDVLREEGLI